MNKKTTVLRCFDNDAYNSNLYITCCGINTKEKTWEERSIKEDNGLWIITDGVVKINITNKEIVLNKGDAFVFFPQQEYQATCLTDTCTFIFTRFSYQIGYNRNALEIYDVDDCFRYPTIKKQADLYIDMLKQYMDKKPISYLTLKGNLSILLAKFIQLKGKKTIIDGEHTKPIIKLLPALDYISAHVSEHISVKTLADTVFLSEKYFCSLFKETFGVSPIKYINDIKLNKALEYLYAKQDTIKDISLLLGYADQFVFSKSFKRKFGISPSVLLKDKK